MVARKRGVGLPPRTKANTRGCERKNAAQQKPPQIVS
jgi:hypothetical protein